MKCNVIAIGTSKGVLIPSHILKELGNPNGFEIVLSKKTLTLTPQKTKNPRENWDKQFAQMAKNGDDKLLLDDNLDLDFIK